MYDFGFLYRAKTQRATGQRDGPQRTVTGQSRRSQKPNRAQRELTEQHERPGQTNYKAKNLNHNCTFT